MSLLPDKMHSSWNDFLDEKILKMLVHIEQSIGNDLNPPKNRILRFLETNIDEAKIVILGQDPYPEKGVATGRAFEVGGLDSWNQPFRQVSLKNIVRLIYKTVNGIDKYEEIPLFTSILKEINNGKFAIAQPPALFHSLEKQGVLFINTSFSVYPAKPLSHTHIWLPFTELLINYISMKNQKLSWFLWGKNAQNFKTLISHGNIYESRHPMMCSASYTDDFLKSNCFKNTRNIVNWMGF